MSKGDCRAIEKADDYYEQRRWHGAAVTEGITTERRQWRVKRD